MQRMLAAELRKLDELLAELRPHVRASLGEGASAGTLAQLSKTVFGGRRLPADLATWFRWHDGQSEIAPISPDDNRTLLSVKQAIRIWRALSGDDETLQPWKRSWLPLFENGAGDYVVYETEGKSAGALIAYWHDWTRRQREAPSLTAWAKRVRVALAKLRKAKFQRVEVCGDGAKWKHTRCPSVAQLDSKPVGTAYYFRQKLFGHPKPYVRLIVKLGAARWIETFEQGFDAAFAEVTSTLAKEPVREWQMDARLARLSIAAAPGARLYEAVVRVR